MKTTRLLIASALVGGLGLGASQTFAANDTSRIAFQYDNPSGFSVVNLVARTPEAYLHAQRQARLYEQRRQMGFSPISVVMVAVDASAQTAPIATRDAKALDQAIAGAPAPADKVRVDQMER